MGIQFSDTSNKNGLVEKLGVLTRTNTASSTSYSLAQKTSDINTALAYFALIALRASGKAQFDDTNQAKYPILRYDLVINQSDYTISVDGESTPNQILKILRVECANSAGKFSVLPKFDQSDEAESMNYLRSLSGQPYRYDELANSVWLDPKPNFNYSAGLEITVERTPTYFLTSDTTKKPGIPDMFHEYLIYRPAFLYCSIHLPNLAKGYKTILDELVKDIELYYAGKNSMEHRNITNKPIAFR